MNPQHTQSSKIKVLMFGPGFNIQGGITSVERLIIEHASSPIEIRHVPTIIRGTALQNIAVFTKAIASLCVAILLNQVDIIHIHFAERGSTLRKTILIAIGLLFRQSIILHAHGATYQEFYEGLPNPIQKIVALLFSKCSKIIVLSKSWQDYYLNRFRLKTDRVAVLYNPVAIPPSIPDRSNRQQLKFIFLGRIGKRGGALDIAKSVISFPKQDKGAFDLIEAFAALPASVRQHAELILAGNGDLDAANELIDKLQLTDKIKILDWLNPVQRDELLAAADVFILPSYNEGLPMSMLESMAWGLPVIVTPVGGIPEAVFDRQNGLLVQPGDRPQLTSALQQLIEDEELRILLGASARSSVKHLNIDNYMNLLSDLYISVTNQHRSIDREFQPRKNIE